MLWPPDVDCRTIGATSFMQPAFDFLHFRLNVPPAIKAPQTLVWPANIVETSK